MARPRKRENQGLPVNLLCRKRKMKSGRIITYFYYVMADGKEKSLGTEKYEAVAEAARLNMEARKKADVILFIEVAKRYELEIIPTKAKSTQYSNKCAIKWLSQFFGDPPIPLDKI